MALEGQGLAAKPEKPEFDHQDPENGRKELS